MKDKFVTRMAGISMDRRHWAVKLAAVLGILGAVGGLLLRVRLQGLEAFAATSGLPGLAGALLLNIKSIGIGAIVAILSCAILAFVCSKSTAWDGRLLLLAFVIPTLYQLWNAISALVRSEAVLWPIIFMLSNLCICAYLLGYPKIRAVPIVINLVAVLGTLYLRTAAVFSFLAASAAINQENESLGAFIPPSSELHSFLLPSYISAILKVFPNIIALLLLLSKSLKLNADEQVK